jgi:hypothetical protein
MLTWDGRNKQYVRLVKAKYAADILKDKKGQALCLTLPGSHGHMEKLLVGAKITTPLKIIGVERDRQYINQLRQNSKELVRMPVLHGKLLDVVQILEGYKFDFFDIDTCGCFCEEHRKLFQQLTSNFSKKGVFCVTLEKGREKGVLNQLDFFTHVPKDAPIREVLKEFYNRVVWREIESGKISITDVGRIISVPSFYIATAQKAGYDFTLQKLIEYNDRPPNMYQYIFTFRPSSIVNEGVDSIAWVWEEYLSMPKKRPRQFIRDTYELHLTGERNENKYNTENTNN